MSAFKGVLGYALFLAVSFAFIASKINANIEREALEATLRSATAAREIAEAQRAEAILSYQRDTLVLTRVLTRWDTVRMTMVDSILAAPDSETVPFPVFADAIHAADSTIAACRDVLTSSRLALTACDSVAASLTRERDAFKRLAAARKQHWRDRLGISCGYGITKVGSDVKTGPQCGATVRLFP